MKKAVPEWKSGVSHVRMSDAPQVSGKGKSEDEAIVNMIRLHPDYFGFTINDPRIEKIESALANLRVSAFAPVQ